MCCCHIAVPRLQEYTNLDIPCISNNMPEQQLLASGIDTPSNINRPTGMRWQSIHIYTQEDAHPKRDLFFILPHDVEGNDDFAKIFSLH